jgi:UDP-N-acetylmuramyl pentapeptide phosphotransferase/UDP-N-acetylglucosamine-1-phosphate transferase
MNVSPATTQLFPSFDSLESAIWPGFSIAVFIASAAIVDVVVILAARWRLVDLPNLRSAHALPTARGGGIAIVTTMALATIAVAIRWPSMALPLLGTLLPAVAIGVVGAIDDIRPLRAIVRLAVQVAAAIVITTAVGPIQSVSLPLLGTINLGIAGWPITVVWIVGLTNAFNFMDGIDGMCGGQAWVAGMVLAIMGSALWVPPLMVLGTCIAGAVGGFLVFNWHPARVFMGDVGSAFLGTFFAAMPLLFPERLRPLALVPFVMAVWPSIFDAGVSVVRRLWNGHNPMLPHREFFFHRLVRSGIAHDRVSLLYALLAAIGGAAGVVTLLPGVPEWVKALMPLWLVVMPVALVWGVESRCANRELAPPGSVSHAPSSS